MEMVLSKAEKEGIIENICFFTLEVIFYSAIQSILFRSNFVQAGPLTCKTMAFMAGTNSMTAPSSLFVEFSSPFLI